jgi:dienelactone hydrolase
MDGWVRRTHTHLGTTHDTYRRGAGPGVLIIPEVPGLSTDVVGFANEVVAAGYTVVLPHLFGEVPAATTAKNMSKVLARLCVSREFTKLSTGETSPITAWLRDVAKHLHREVGGRGVGALGMCFTGGFALALMVDPWVTAPIVAQPSLPFAVGAKRAADLNLSPDDLACVKQRAGAGQQVLGLRYRSDKAVGTRFETLTRELGPAFIRVELEGRGHSTLTTHRQQEAVDAVLKFLADNLTDPA